VPTRRAFLLAAAAIGASRALAVEPTWDRLRHGGLVILMRHASTVAGAGDPPGFRLDDCATQRNLSEAGREEARRVGARLRAAGVPIEHVYSSPWCRCHETALLAFGATEDWDPLGSFFDSPERDDERSEHVRKRIASYTQRKPRGNVVMVTHSVNIASLTKRNVGPAEIVVVRPDGCCGLRTLEQLKLA